MTEEVPRPRGRKGGRKPTLTPAQIAEARALWDSRTVTIVQLAARYGIARSTMYGHVRPGARTTTEESK